MFDDSKIEISKIPLAMIRTKLIVCSSEIFELYVLNSARTKETSDFKDVDYVFFLMIWSRKVVVRHKTCTIDTEYRI